MDGHSILELQETKYNHPKAKYVAEIHAAKKSQLQ